MSTGPALAWPEDLAPVEMAVWLRAPVLRSQADWSGQLLVRRRGPARWQARLRLRLSAVQARRLDALLARLGETGEVIVPLFHRRTGAMLAPSFSAYADEIGETVFSDGWDFDDGSAVYPLAAEGSETLASEDGATLMGERLGGFVEGTGAPRLLGGAWEAVAVDGFAPFSDIGLSAGGFLKQAAGRASLITRTLKADANGYARLPIRPRLRAPLPAGAIDTEQASLRLRVVGARAGRTSASGRRPTMDYDIALEEVLP